MKSTAKLFHHDGGFTLIELLFIMGIMAILLGIVTINLARLQRGTNLSSTAEKIDADLKNQQLKAMSGQSANGTNGDQYGIYFVAAAHEYMLFHGSTYTVDCTANLCVPLDSSITVTPSTNPIIFAQQSGVLSAATTIQLSNSVGEQKTIKMNLLGVITQ